MRLLLLIFTFVSAIVHGQNDSGNSTIRRTTNDSNLEVIFHDKHKKFATVKTYSTTGILETEESYSDYNFKEKQGFTKCYYPSGQLYWICDYDKNQVNGEFRAYYESGALKRKELYKRGVRKMGICLDENEKDIPFYDFFRPTAYSGGMYALQAHIRKYLKNNKVGSNTQFANINLIIKNDSSAVHNLLVPNELTPLSAITQMIADMPKWLPAYYDGLPLTTVYSLNLVFSHGQVYIAELAPRFSNSPTLPIHNSGTTIPTAPPPLAERKRIRK
jgi:antitoxin component YwqK of YwqJK toxin-antitoxin module